MSPEVFTSGLTCICVLTKIPVFQAYTELEVHEMKTIITIITILMTTALVASAKTWEPAEPVLQSTWTGPAQTTYVQLDEVVVHAEKTVQDPLASDVVRALQGFKRPKKATKTATKTVTCYEREMAMAARVGETVQICDTI